MSRRVCLVVGLACVLSAGAASSTASDPVGAAESAAEASAATAQGKKFRDAVGMAFGREHGKTVQACAKELGRPDLSTFILLLQISGVGEVEQALVKPRTNLAVCVQGRLKGWKAGVPPAPGVWVKVRIQKK